MSRWTCPACDREFANEHQAHVCVPGCTVETVFKERPGQRVIYDAVIEHLAGLGPVHEDAVKVGVFLKHERKLAEVRPKARCLSLEIVLPRTVDSPRIARSIRISADRVVHIVKLLSIEDVDDEVRTWLTEAYVAAG